MDSDRSQPLPAGYWPRRYTMVGLCFAAIVICYIDRVNISVAVIPMAEELGWDQTVRGIVLSSFFYGYLATQIIGGWLSDRLGGKLVLGVGVLLWSLFTVLTPPAAMGGIVLLFIVRVAMGMGEGVSFPAVFSLFARWVPQRERARAAGIVIAGIPLGTITALVVTPLIVVRLGWEWAFYLFGALGVFWYASWHYWAAPRPELHRSVAPQELELIQRDPGIVTKDHDTPWRLLLSQPPVWAIIINHFCNNWGLYVILTWLPTYVNEALGVRIADLGFYTMIPYAVMFLFLNVAGWLADTMITRGISVTATRKIMQTIAFGGSALFLLLIGGITDATHAIIVMSCATGAAAFANGGFGVNHLDIAPRHAGALMGITNTAGTLPGIIGVTLTGMILDATGSWALVFGVAAGVYLFGLVVWLIFATSERIFD